MIVVHVRTLLVGLVLGFAGTASGMHSPPSHLLMRQYRGYYDWLKQEKLTHSVAALSSYISSLIHSEVKELAKLVNMSKADLDYRKASRAVPFDVAAKSFDEEVRWPMQMAAVHSKYINSRIQHLEMLKKELAEERRIMSKL